MKIEVSDATEIPEWMQPHVSDGHLDLAAIPVPEDVTGLKTALQKERETAGAYSKLGKPDEIAEKMAALEEKAKGTGKGAEDAQAKLDAMKAEKDKAVAEWQGKYMSTLQRQAMSELKAELASSGILPKYLDMIAGQAMSRVKFSDDGSLQLYNSDGGTMLGTGEHYSATLSDLAKEVAGGLDEIMVDNGKPGSGKPPRAGGTPDRKTITRSQFDGMSQLERSEFSKSGGKVTND